MDKKEPKIVLKEVHKKTLNWKGGIGGSFAITFPMFMVLLVFEIPLGTALIISMVVYALLLYLFRFDTSRIIIEVEQGSEDDSRYAALYGKEYKDLKTPVYRDKWEGELTEVEKKHNERLWNKDKELLEAIK